MSRIRIAQVTDTHLFQDPEARLKGYPTWHTLKAVLEEVRQIQPDLILLTGDLADRGELQAYHHLVDLINPLQIPCYWLPGNHDDPALMPEVFAGSWMRAEKTFEIGGWRLILLDSVLAGVSHGHLSQSSLQKLADDLSADAEKPTLVALHHNPVPIGSALMDGLGLDNPEALFTCIDQAPQVRLILFGHIHWEFHLRRGPVDIYGTPSSCRQLPPSGVFASADEKLPGFRLLDLDPSGQHQTFIRRASAQIMDRVALETQLM